MLLAEILYDHCPGILVLIFPPPLVSLSLLLTSIFTLMSCSFLPLLSGNRDLYLGTLCHLFPLFLWISSPFALSSLPVLPVIFSLFIHHILPVIIYLSSKNSHSAHTLVRTHNETLVFFLMEAISAFTTDPLAICCRSNMHHIHSHNRNHTEVISTHLLPLQTKWTAGQPESLLPEGPSVSYLLNMHMAKQSFTNTQRIFTWKGLVQILHHSPA